MGNIPLQFERYYEIHWIVFLQISISYLKVAKSIFTFITLFTKSLLWELQGYNKHLS